MGNVKHMELESICLKWVLLTDPVTVHGVREAIKTLMTTVKLQEAQMSKKCGFLSVRQ